MESINQVKNKKMLLRTASGNCIIDFDVLQFREFGLKIKMSRTSCQGVEALTKIEENNSSMCSRSASTDIKPVDRASVGKLLRTPSGNNILDFDVLQFSEFGLEIQTERS